MLTGISAENPVGSYIENTCSFTLPSPCAAWESSVLTLEGYWLIPPAHRDLRHSLQRYLSFSYSCARGTFTSQEDSSWPLSPTFPPHRGESQVFWERSGNSGAEKDETVWAGCPWGSSCANMLMWRGSDIPGARKRNEYMLFHKLFGAPWAFCSWRWRFSCEAPQNKQRPDQGDGSEQACLFVLRFEYVSLY